MNNCTGTCMVSGPGGDPVWIPRFLVVAQSKSCDEKNGLHFITVYKNRLKPSSQELLTIRTLLIKTSRKKQRL